MRRCRILGSGDQHFAFQQLEAALLGAEGDVQCAAGIDQQLRAVGQGQVLLFAGGRVLVRAPLLPGQLVVGDPGRRAGQQEQPQAMKRLAPAHAFVAAQALQGIAGDGAGYRAQVAEQGFGALPGLGVLSAAGTPLRDGSMVFGSGGSGLQLHQPVGGFAKDLRINGRVHQATLRQARKASRI
ncbi:hypothetical protein D3C86_1656670 [compost metagenome]